MFVLYLKIYKIYKMKNRISVLSVLVLLLVITNCKTNTKQEVSEDIVKTVYNAMKFEIAETFTNFKLDYQTVSCAVGKEFKYKFSDGTEILVPADAFVDENGNPVKGDVSIKYKSIKSPSEIIASGLHLLYKQGDSVVPFITGGMFELNAEQNGKQLKLKTGSAIKMNYASIDSSNYNFYYYDKVKNEWSYLSDANKLATDKIVEDNKFDNQTSDNSVGYALKPVLYNEETDFIVMMDLNYKKIPQLAKLTKVMWKYTGSKTKAEITALITKKWKSTDFVENKNKKGEYLVELKGEKSEEKIEVTPVFSKAEYNKALALYDASINNKQEDVNKVANSDTVEEEYVSREVSLINLGTYNVDVCALENAYGVYANFTFSDKTYDNGAKDYKYFVISNNGQSVTRYNLANTNVVAFFKNTNTKIIAILPDNKVAVMSSSDFSNLTLKPQTEVTFNLNVIAKTVESEAELDKIISSI